MTMTSLYGLALHDANFYRWLDKQAARNAALDVRKPTQKKVGLMELLRREFEPKVLARLNALGLAT